MANTLILLSDEHNPAFCSAYGHPFILTPNMERLAERGTVYDAAYCPSPLCMPSRSAFLAGRRVHELQTYSNCSVNMPKGVPTYGGALRGRGVHTAYMGKTHVYDRPENLGFSEMIAPSGYGEPGDTNHGRRPLSIRTDAHKRAGHYGPRDDAYRREYPLIEQAVEWIRGRATTLDRPWCLTVSFYNEPHFGHFTTQELWDLYPQTGMDCFESLAQPPEGDTDLGEVKSALGPHMALSGGIDQKEFMVNASVAEVAQKVAQVLEIMKPGGGYILSTVDYLAEDTPLEDVQAFVDAGMKYGRYVSD